MDARIDLITFGVADLDVARAFYVDGLGWEVALDVPGEITFVHLGPGRLLGLWSATELAADMGAAPSAAGAPHTHVTHAQVVSEEADVTAALAAAAAAGGTVLKPAQHAAFGGFHGYFADPDGHAWEIATNPGWTVDADGRVRIAPVEPT